jgi:cyclic pyranopterin phosphate synthase
LQLTDRNGKAITYLRISLTDRCNLKCFYCHPKEGIEVRSRSSLLTFEELARVVSLARGLGVEKFRLTGGEPLLRRDVVELVGLLSEAARGGRLALTSNGVLLADMAQDLRSRGLRSVNISLDTLQRKKFEAITGEDALDSVLAGISRSVRSGLEVKINVVLLQGLNDSEILDFVSLAQKLGIEVRFIELMPYGRNGDALSTLPAALAREVIREAYALSPAEKDVSSGPAQSFRLGNGPGKVGFIAPVTEGFCDRCNRLRLTCDGRLKPCLASRTSIDLRSALRRSETDDVIERLFFSAVDLKPEGNFSDKACALLGGEIRESGG